MRKIFESDRTASVISYYCPIEYLRPQGSLRSDYFFLSNVPLLPPDFFINWISEMVIVRSVDLHMS
jgi:hypothetical protein